MADTTSRRRSGRRPQADGRPRRDEEQHGREEGAAEEQDRPAGTAEREDSTAEDEAQERTAEERDETEATAEEREQEEPAEEQEEPEDDERSERLSAKELTDAAVATVADLTGFEPESVAGLQWDGDSWLVTVDVLELARIPNTTDVIASYVVQLDDGGALLGYKRMRRFVRGQVEGD